MSSVCGLKTNYGYYCDSFDRYGDDFCHLVLGFLTVSDKLKLRCVSSQWNNLIFKEQHALDIFRNGSKMRINNVFITANQFNEKLITIFGHFKFIKAIHIQVELFELVMDYLHNLKCLKKVILHDRYTVHQLKNLKNSTDCNIIFMGPLIVEDNSDLSIVSSRFIKDVNFIEMKTFSAGIFILLKPFKNLESLNINCDHTDQQLIELAIGCPIIKTLRIKGYHMVHHPRHFEILSYFKCAIRIDITHERFMAGWGSISDMKNCAQLKYLSLTSRLLKEDCFDGISEALPKLRALKICSLNLISFNLNSISGSIFNQLKALTDLRRLHFNVLSVTAHTLSEFVTSSPLLEVLIIPENCFYPQVINLFVLKANGNKSKTFNLIDPNLWYPEDAPNNAIHNNLIIKKNKKSALLSSTPRWNFSFN